MVNEKGNIYRFGSFILNNDLKEVRVSGELKKLKPKQYAFLLLLVKNSDRYVEKDELLEIVWENVPIEENRLNSVVSELRGILGGQNAILNKPVLNFKFNPQFFVNVDTTPCPWIGLKYYDESTQDYFFGRNKDIDKIIGKLKVPPFLCTLISNSGVGKSSLVRAGVIPKLETGGNIDGSENWKYISLRPTSHPLRELSIKIASLQYSVSELTEDIIDRIINNLKNDPKSIIQELDYIKEEGIFLFIDQIEELLSKNTDKSEASIFAEALLVLSKNHEITKALIINLRRDFYNQFCNNFEKWSPIITENMIEILEMTGDQLKQVIEKPAYSVRLKLEDGLSDRVVADITSNKSSYSGILPLLSIFLVELFKYREDNEITFSKYYSSGGIENSISRYADDVFNKLTDEQKPFAETLFILLSDIGERPELDSCKPMAEEKLISRFPERKEELRQIIQILIKKRILVNRADLLKNQQTIEIPHASLIKNWSKMQHLLNPRRRAIRFATEVLERKTELWLKSGKNADELLKGIQLETALELFDDYEAYIGKNEKDFFSASQFAKNEELVKLRQDEKRRKWQKRGIISLVIFVAILGIFIVYNNIQNQKIDIAKMTASTALAELDKNPADALKLAIQAAETDKSENTAAILQAAIMGTHLRKSLTGHTAALTTIAVSNDGRFLITSSRDNTARVWDKESGKLLYKLEGHTKEVECASFSPDSKFAVTSSSDETARVWDLSNGKEIRKIETGQGGVNNVVVSPDGKFILTAGENDTAVVWDFNSNEKLLVLSHPKKSSSENLGINSAIFSLDGKLIATGSKDKTAIIWNAASGEMIKTLEHPDSVLNLAFSPDGSVLITACRDSVARVWKSENWKLQNELRGHQGQVNCVAFNSTGERLVTASMDKTAILWDWQKGKNLLLLKGHTGALTSAIFSSDSRFIYTSSGDTEAGIWEINENFIIKTITGHNNEVYEVSYSSDGQTILTAGKDGTARIWKTESGELIKLFTHISAVRSAKFSPDDKSVATATEDGKIYLWEIESGKAIKNFPGHNNRINSIVFDPTGRILASADKVGVVKLWDVFSGKELKHFNTETNSKDAEITRLAFNQNGNLLAASSKDRSVKFWDIFSLNLLDSWKIGTGSINSVVFGADNNNVLVSGSDKSLRIWNEEKKKQIGVFLGHTEIVNWAEYSLDGKFIVSTSEDSTIRIWSVLLQRELFSIEDKITSDENSLSKETPIPLYASFSPNGKDIVYANNYGVIKIINCPICSVSSDKLIEIAKKRLPQKIEDVDH